MKNINKKNLKKILYKMLLIRETDLQISRRYSESQMRCPTHLSIGQECVPSVVGTFTNKKDLCVSSHRSHAHFLGKGGSLKKFISELYGKEIYEFSSSTGTGRKLKELIIDESRGK